MKSELPTEQELAALADRVRGLLAPEAGLGTAAGTDAPDDWAQIYAGYSLAAAAEVFGIEDEICVLDVETTGISPASEAIIEVAVAKMRDPEIIGEFSTYVNPGRPISREITELTNISDADVADAPFFDDIADELRAFVGERAIVAHNASFDRGFIEAALSATGTPLPGQWLDSLVFLRCGLPLLRSFRLEDLMRAYCQADYKQAHRAISDVRGLCHLWRVGLVGISALDAAVLRALPLLLHDLPEAAWIARIAQLYAAADSTGGSGTGGTAKRPAIRLKTLRQKQIQGSRPDALVDAQVKEAIVPVSAADLSTDLSAAGTAGKMYPAFEVRPEQEQMALAIRDAFAAREHLVVEAGTGVGKSLAYLVCLARLARENNITVGVATKTNALTDQLMGKELPKLARALAQEDEETLASDGPDSTALSQPLPALRYAALKGYTHYPCLRKLNAVLTADEDAAGESSSLATAQLLAWVSQTAWGELSSVNLAASFAQKRRYAASSADCLRVRCSYYYHCYVHAARRIAKSSHIIVTNHSLLFRNSAADGRILPPVRYWVIDEAHNIEAEARKQLTRSFAEQDLNALLTSLMGVRGLPKKLLIAAPKFMRKADVEKIAAAVEQLHVLLQQVQTLASSFFAYAHDLAEHESIEHNPAYATSKASRTYWIGPALRESAAWTTLCSIGLNLSSQLQASIASGSELSRAFASHVGEESPPDALSDFAASLALLSEQADALATAINEPAKNLVYALHQSREYQGKRSAAIEISQLEVGEKVASELLEQTDSVIFTSATLAVGDSFSRFSSGTGLDTLPREKWNTLQLPSSYDLPNLMRIVVPTDMPRPRDLAWEGCLIDFLRAVHLRTGGGVLTLFTSRKDLLTCRDVLQDDLKPAGIELLAQDGMLSMRVLQERFIADPQASLLATKSFWEGFDASGDTLRCIVIPKLPFGRPDTPLACERNQVYGRSAWARFDLPETILELKQAVGRLVRTSTDSGVVILADSRVLSKNYGRRVLDALPVPAEALSIEALLELL
ncbi:MAG: exonuclease domain-containing protein [Coriobacteriia bacterium]|nr:exonuclease domain-containing protein [Coriobacteriia bacterium]